MATSVKYDEEKKELIVHGVTITHEQARNVRSLLKLVIDNLADTVPAEVVQKDIKKRIPLAGTPAGTLKAYRSRENLTQAQLANMTGIAQGHISEMERGNRVVGIKIAKKLAKALNCRWEKLVT